ncbi:MAG: hypothetical protein KG075_03890 [Alphaproteobacteria bacterium]|nr:hypothetical protein [Alphaproteobacteria bacterium]
MTTFAGIDPGALGAIALYAPADGALTIFDMPVFEILTGKKKRKRIDIYALARFFDLHASSIALVAIEDVHAMPGQGVTSMFSFGRALGVAEMAVAAHQVPIEYIAARKWKGAFGLDDDKEKSRLVATRLLPRHADQWAVVRGVRDKERAAGRAEAALLAMFAHRIAQERKIV